ncbi:EF-hand domain-containing protein [Rhodoferax sp.]|uniref:EF-hand domain-containing protein n=1 Tax=Rhodoferax sp. TaxID=50421 RepID=UPI0025F00E1B|nr:EF-hand domain-containing protein [Rhodoferax sp.]
MASISSLSSNNSNAWATMAAERKAKLFAKTDTDGNGGVDSTELQTLMDKVSERTGVTNPSTAADLMSKLDSNGDGTLDATELQKGIPSIVPLPSTMDFAQARSTGGTGSADTSNGITTTVTTTVSGDSDGDSDAFASLDTDGNGQLSKAEFDATKPHGAGGPPPTGAASSSDSTVYDPLDTNKDGIVSAAEAAAGAANGTTSTTDTLQALLKAIDTDKDGTLSNTEADAFAKQVSTAIETLQKSSATNANGTDRIDINQLAQQVLKQYADIAAGQSSQTSGSTVSVSA